MKPNVGNKYVNCQRCQFVESYHHSDGSVIAKCYLRLRKIRKSMISVLIRDVFHAFICIAYHDDTYLYM